MADDTGSRIPDEIGPEDAADGPDAAESAGEAAPAAQPPRAVETRPPAISTARGIGLLIGASYVMAVGLAGLNAADTTGSRWLWGLLFVVGCCVGAWSVLLPWSGRRGR